MNVLNRMIRGLDKVAVFCKGVNVFSIFAVFAMTVMTTLDVISRLILKDSIKGLYELTSAIMVLVVFLGLAYAQEQKAHVAVDLFTSRLKPAGKIASDMTNALICLLLSLVMVWRATTQTIYFFKNNVSTNHSVYLPAGVFAVIMVLGCILFLSMFVRDYLMCIQEGIKKKISAKHWAIGIILPLIIIGLALFFMYYDGFSVNKTVVGIACIVVSVLLMFIGLPISIAFIFTALVFTSILSNPSTAFNLLSTELFSTTTSANWTVIPFFVFLGFIVFVSELGNDLYRAAYYWLGKLSGGLAIATVTASAAFASVVGNGTAPCVTMGAVALPEMRRYKYDEELSNGAIIGGCSLGPLIPPSQPLIIYALLSAQSVGQLFMASLVPGLLIWLAMAVYIWIHCKIKPSAGPKGTETFTRKQKWSALASASPVLLLFIVVIGGIYKGIFSATEAGAIGCAVALIIALLMRRLTWERFKTALIETGKTTAMIMLLLIGAQMVSRVIALSKLPAVLGDLIASLSMNPNLAVAVILLIFFLLGFVVDMMPLILIGVPVCHPAIVALGFDPIWFTIMLSTTICLGSITPPVGINLFTLKGVAREVPIGTIYKGAFPFVIVTFVVLVFCFFAKGIITWLPNLMY